MPRVNPILNEIREQKTEQFSKERDTRREEALHLISQCDQVQLLWCHLPHPVQEKMCRFVDTARESQGITSLAARLSVDRTNVAFYRQRTQGCLTGPTQLMLEDVERQREPLRVELLLSHLLESNLFRCLADITCGVQEAIAQRQQFILQRKASTETEESSSTMESGYLGSLNAADSDYNSNSLEYQYSVDADDKDGLGMVVGTVTGPPDAKLVHAVPVGNTPHRPTSTTPPPPNRPPFQEDTPLLPSITAKTKPSGPRLLLTYADDGRDAAILVADQMKLRDFRVLLLEEQRRWQLLDRYTAVQKWFTQVAYVVPILTAQYLAATQNRAEYETEKARKLAEDVRFIYTLMCAELEKNGHLNWRVRCIVPDGVGAQIERHPVYGSPLFRWPFRISELDELAELLWEE